MKKMHEVNTEDNTTTSYPTTFVNDVKKNVHIHMNVEVMMMEETRMEGQVYKCKDSTWKEGEWNDDDDKTFLMLTRRQCNEQDERRRAWSKKRDGMEDGNEDDSQSGRRRASVTTCRGK